MALLLRGQAGPVQNRQESRDAHTLLNYVHMYALCVLDAGSHQDVRYEQISDLARMQATEDILRKNVGWCWSSGPLKLSKNRNAGSSC